MGEGRKKGPGGGGAALNFKVKDYATEELLMAATGNDNEIGIITSTPMTGWHFAAEQPEMQPGCVWFITGAASQFAFNALKKDRTVMVYPIGAKQMQADGSLVDLTAKIWMDGKWVDLIQELVVLKDGVLSVGQWMKHKSSQLTNGTINAVQNVDSGNSGWISEKIDTTNYSKLIVRCKIDSIYTSFNFGFASQTLSGLTQWDAELQRLVAFTSITKTNSNYKEYELDLTKLTPGEYYLTIVAIATYSIDYMVVK